MRIVHISVCLAQMYPDMAQEWTEWLDKHGIDPTDVLVGHDIRCDDEERRIYWTSYERDENGKAKVWEKELVYVEHFVQLESPALPMPSEATWAGRSLR